MMGTMGALGVGMLGMGGAGDPERGVDAGTGVFTGSAMATAADAADGEE